MTKAEIQQVKLRFGIIGNNETLMRAIDIAIDNFKAYLRGEPVSVINK